jgi:hypothetical protein
LLDLRGLGDNPFLGTIVLGSPAAAVWGSPRARLFRI